MLDPDYYSKYKKLQKRNNFDILDKYFHLVQLQPDGNDEILDVGCGDGESTVEILLAKFPKKSQMLIGCDKSENMINFASKKYQENKQVSFIKLDITTKAFPKELEQRFHHVFSFLCLHWVSDQRQSIKNIYNSLKPGGNFTITVGAPNFLYILYKEMTKSGKWTKYLHDLEDVMSSFYDNQDPAEDLKTLLENAGFCVRVCTKIEGACAHDNVQDLRDSMLAMSPFTRRIPEHEMADFLKDTIETMEKMNFLAANTGNNEKLTIRYSVVYAFATKL